MKSKLRFPAHPGSRIAAVALLGVMVACADQPTSPEREIAESEPLAALSTPITQTLLTAGNDPAFKKAYTTASISPAPNALITVAVLGHRGQGAGIPTVTGGGMAAWAQVATVTFASIGTPQKRLTIYRAMSASPGSGPITITFPQALASAQWIVSQWSGVETSGVNGSGAIVQTGSARADAGTGLTVTLAPFADPNNKAYGVFGVKKNALAVAPGAGFTEIAEQRSNENPPSDLQAEWATNDNTINASWANASAAALGVEIRAGGGGGGGGGVSASQSTVTADVGSIPVGSGTATITVTAKDASGNPVSGATVVLSASGTGNTLTQPAGPTNSAGVATGTLSSSVAETKTISATANGTAITQTATVQVVAGTPGSITHTLLTGGKDTANKKVFTTASISPASNTLITLAVMGHRGVTATPSPIVTGGGMGAWEEVATVVFDSLSIPSKRMTIFRALSATPGSGPLTITFANTVSNAIWIVSQWDGVDLSGANGAGAIVQTGSVSADRVTGLTATLAPFAHPNNVAYGVVGVKKNVLAVTPGAGFTEIDEQPSGESTTSDLQAQWATNDNTIDATWPRSNSAVLGVEIKAANTGP